MPSTPIVFKSKHRIKFSDLDPYNHMGTARYAAYFMDHRTDGVRDYVGWDIKSLATLPFMAFVRRIEIDFIRPVAGDQEITITSSIREFNGPDAHVECTMRDDADRELAHCVIIVAYVDKATNRAADWTPEAIAPFFEP
jgi:acyl-CoA thioester hydrolase